MSSDSIEQAKNRAFSRASTLSSLDKYYAEQKVKTGKTKIESNETQKFSITQKPHVGGSMLGSEGRGQENDGGVDKGDNCVESDSAAGHVVIEGGDNIVMENSHGIVAVIKQYITSLRAPTGAASSSQVHADTRLTRTLSDQLINKAIILQNAPDTAKSSSRIRNQIKSQKIMSKRKWKALSAASQGTVKSARGDDGGVSASSVATISVFDLISLQRMWVSYIQMTAMNKYIDSVGGQLGVGGRAAAHVALSQLQAKLGTVSLVGAFVQVIEDSSDAGNVGVHGYVTKESVNCYHLTRVVFDTSGSGGGAEPNTQLLSVALLEQYAGKYVVSSVVLLKEKCSVGILLPVIVSGSVPSGAAPKSLGETAELACIVRGKEFYPFCKERSGGVV